MVGNIIGTIIFGAVIGVLARLVIPGKQAMGWVITVVLGIIGALIGYWVWEGSSARGTPEGSTGSGGSSALPQRPCCRSDTPR